MKLNKIMEEMGESGECIGDVNFETMGLASSKPEKKKLTFIDDIKYIKDISLGIDVILTTSEIAPSINGNSICICNNPRMLFFKIHNFLSRNSEYIRKEFDTQIKENCTINSLAYISPKNVQIGCNVIIEEFVSIKPDTIVGDNSVIRAGSIIGGIGFEFKRTDENILPVEHTGAVKIGHDVEIQQNCCIDKAIYPWDETVIGNYCKLDNLVHIAHAVKLEERVFIASKSFIAGRTKIGADAWIGPGVGIINALTVGKKARVNVGSIVMKDVEAEQNVAGNPARVIKTN